MASALSPSICHRGVSPHQVTFRVCKGKGIQVYPLAGEHRMGPQELPQCLPHKNGEWLFPFSLPQIHRPIEDIVLDILKASRGMEGPKAELSLPWALRPEFCCLDYTSPSNYTFYD